MPHHSYYCYELHESFSFSRFGAQPFVGYIFGPYPLSMQRLLQTPFCCFFHLCCRRAGYTCSAVGGLFWTWIFMYSLKKVNFLWPLLSDAVLKPQPALQKGGLWQYVQRYLWSTFLEPTTTVFSFPHFHSVSPIRRDTELRSLHGLQKIASLTESRLLLLSLLWWVKIQRQNIACSFVTRTIYLRALLLSLICASLIWSKKFIGHSKKTVEHI